MPVLSIDAMVVIVIRAHIAGSILRKLYSISLSQVFGMGKEFVLEAIKVWSIPVL
jgi:hypothetical protein